MSPRWAAWLGSALALGGGFVGYFVSLGVPWIRNTAAPNAVLAVAGVALAASGAWRKPSPGTLVPLGLALVAGGGFLAVRFGLAALPEASGTPREGDPFPLLSLRMPDGTGVSPTFSSPERPGAPVVDVPRPAVVVFFRGFW